jgi:hypothetical protein
MAAEPLKIYADRLPLPGDIPRSAGSSDARMRSQSADDVPAARANCWESRIAAMSDVIAHELTVRRGTASSGRPIKSIERAV